MSSRKVTRQWKRRATSAGSLRIMPGAFSRASHSVTRNSAASCRVLSSSCSASAIWKEGSRRSQVLSLC